MDFLFAFCLRQHGTLPSLRVRFFSVQRQKTAHKEDMKYRSAEG
jgi:hypothetical protein